MDRGQGGPGAANRRPRPHCPTPATATATPEQGTGRETDRCGHVWALEVSVSLEKEQATEEQPRVGGAKVGGRWSQGWAVTPSLCLTQAEQEPAGPLLVTTAWHQWCLHFPGGAKCCLRPPEPGPAPGHLHLQDGSKQRL